jgi:hypothetical protein
VKSEWVLMSMKAGATARGVDGFPGVRRQLWSDCNNAVAGNGDVARHTGGAGSVK